jgi:hypothetical protein
VIDALMAQLGPQSALLAGLGGLTIIVLGSLAFIRSRRPPD